MLATVLTFILMFGIFGTGFVTGFKTRRLAMKEFSREVKTNLKADDFTQAIFGEGVTDDNLEPDDFEKKKAEQSIMGDRSFYA